MKITVSILLSMMVLNALGNLIRNVRQPKEIAQRRQFIGYSNNIIHENPNFPDQMAQSSVKVNFDQNERQPIYHQFVEQPQNYQTDTPQSQLFNVGYSVSFASKPKALPSPKYQRINLDDGEIITGTRKFNEEIQVPNLNTASQNFVPTTALLGTKKQKISGIKPKPQIITNYPNPKTLLTQANLSPTTQKFYKTLEQVKPQIQNTQDLQQRYTWRNLSPGVEIIRSTEVPTSNQKFSRPIEQSIHFDHVKALGRSQEFDYTNAVDNNSNIQQQQQPSNLIYGNNFKKTQISRTPQPLVLTSSINQKLPVDTTLLRDTVPIQVDTRLVDEAMKNSYNYYQNKLPQQESLTVHDNYLQQQNYRTIPVQQNNHFQEIYQQEEPRGLKDYQSDQTRFQYKIYGKPQPLGNVFNEKAKEQIQRQPRFLMGDLNTNLRPPPFTTVYQRRIHIG